MNIKAIKIVKIVLLVFFALICLWGALFMIDHHRMKTAEFGTKPLICLKTEKNWSRDNTWVSRVAYQSIFYRIDWRDRGEEAENSIYRYHVMCFIGEDFLAYDKHDTDEMKWDIYNSTPDWLLK